MHDLLPFSTLHWVVIHTHKLTHFRFQCFISSVRPASIYNCCSPLCSSVGRCVGPSVGQSIHFLSLQISNHFPPSQQHATYIRPFYPWCCVFLHVSTEVSQRAKESPVQGKWLHPISFSADQTNPKFVFPFLSLPSSECFFRSTWDTNLLIARLVINPSVPLSVRPPVA